MTKKPTQAQTKDQRIAAYAKEAYAKVRGKFDEDIAVVADYFVIDEELFEAGDWQAVLQRHAGERNAETRFEKAVGHLRNPRSGYWRHLRREIGLAVDRVRDEDQAAADAIAAAEQAKRDAEAQKEADRQEAERIRQLLKANPENKE